MKRYYLSKIVGDGLTPNTAYRPKVAVHGVSWTGQIPTDSDGKPLKQWALVIVDATNHSALLADPGIEAFPDFPLDGKVSAMHTPTKAAMVAMLKAAGVDTSFVQNTDGFREVVRGVGKQFSPDFDENNFDVAE